LPVSLAQGEQKLLEEELAKSTQDALPKYEEHVDFNPLRAIIKLLKAHRDTMFLPAAVADLRPISIIITTLAAQAYQLIAQESVISPRRSTDLLMEIVERSGLHTTAPNGWHSGGRCCSAELTISTTYGKTYSTVKA
jgi:hypothetical protein